MTQFLKLLDIKESEKSIFYNFFFLNLCLYIGIFLGRTIRDSLFFSKVGAEYLPIIYIANAISMVFFGVYFAKWTNNSKKLLSTSIKLFIACFIVIGIFTVLLNFNIGILTESEKLIIGVFYFITEIPLFIMLVLIWIIADHYITESQGQRLNPKIIGGGHIGIVIGGSIALFFPLYLSISVEELSFIWLIIFLIAIFFIFSIRKNCTPILYENSKIINDDKYNEKLAPQSFITSLRLTWETVKKYNYTFIFLIITFCNFFIFSLSDYMLNVGANDAKISEELLVEYLAIGTIAFGISSAVLQFSFLTKLIKNIGYAKVNRIASLLFLLGYSFLLLTNTNLFAPIKYFILNYGFEEASWFLYSIIFVRFLGYIAEYLINQSVLPALYSVIPEKDREDTRTFVEGTFVQLVYGAAGFFLIFYNLLWHNNLDLIILLGGIAAVIMLIYSNKLIPEYSSMVLFNKMEFKEKWGEKISDYVNKLSPLRVYSLLKKENTRIQSVIISKLKGEGISENNQNIIKTIALNNTDASKEAIKKCFEIKEGEKEILDRYIEGYGNTFLGFKTSNIDIIKTLLTSALKSSQYSAQTEEFLSYPSTLNQIPKKQLKAILNSLALRNNNSIFKLFEMINSISDKHLRYELSLEFGVKNDFEKLLNNLNNNINQLKTTKSINLVSSDFLFDNIKNDLEILKTTTFLLNDKLTTELSENLFFLLKYLPFSQLVLEILQKLTSKNIKLTQKVIEILNKTYNSSELQSSYLPLMLQNVTTNLQENYSVDHYLLETLKKSISPEISLSIYQVIANRIKKGISSGHIDTKIINELFEQEFKKLLLCVLGISIYKNSPAVLVIFKKLKHTYIEAILWIILLVQPKEQFDVYKLKKNISSPINHIKDDTLTLLEQLTPREYFKKIDKYMLLESDDFEIAKWIEHLYQTNSLDFFRKNIALIGKEHLQLLIDKYKI